MYEAQTYEAILSRMLQKALSGYEGRETPFLALPEEVCGLVR